MIDIMQVFWRWRCSCNDFGNIQHCYKLFLGCKSGASLGSICFELRRILGGGAALPRQPACQISGTPQAVARDTGAC